jgi:hypothetical protein
MFVCQSVYDGKWQYKTYRKSKKAYSSKADYIKRIVWRLTKNSPVDKDGYAKLAYPIAVKLCGQEGLSRCLKSLWLDYDGKPNKDCGEGKFVITEGYVPRFV